MIDGVYSDGFGGDQQRGVDLNGRNGGDMVVIPIVVSAALMVVLAVTCTSCSGGASVHVYVRTRVFIVVKNI